MAVKRCPRCGDLYLAAVDVCADCGEALEEVDAEPQVEGGGDAPALHGGDHDQWDLGAWTMEGRRLLDGMLANSGIPRSWQGATLLTPMAARPRVDELVAEVSASDARVGADDAVGYEVSDWTDDALDRLVALLQRDRVPYGWDADGDLEVAARYEATVDAIFDELSGEGLADPEAGAPGDDGLEGHQALSEVFLAADRLARNPADAAATRSLAAAHQRMGHLALPFGFSPQTWAAVADRAGALCGLIDDPGTPSEEVEAEAGAVRDLLRDYL